MMGVSQTRLERDSLGEVHVPEDALFGAQTQRAAENFPVSGLRPWRAFIWAKAVIKRAAADANRDLGLLDERLAKAIGQAAQEVAAGRWEDHFVVNPFQAGAGIATKIGRSRRRRSRRH
jgi:fumarate hydratase class II